MNRHTQRNVANYIHILYLAAIGLTPGGSDTAHIYTQQYTEYKERNIHNNHKIKHA